MLFSSRIYISVLWRFVRHLFWGPLSVSHGEECVESEGGVHNQLAVVSPKKSRQPSGLASVHQKENYIVAEQK